jgi:hypothetical protein
VCCIAEILEILVHHGDNKEIRNIRNAVGASTQKTLGPIKLPVSDVSAVNWGVMSEEYFKQMVGGPLGLNGDNQRENSQNKFKFC